MGDDDLYGRRRRFGDGKEIRLGVFSIFNECIYFFVCFLGGLDKIFIFWVTHE